MAGAGWVRSRKADDGIRIFPCPECSALLPSLEELGMHLYRHMPSGTPVVGKSGKVLSTPCRRGCGRYFLLFSVRYLKRPREAGLYQEHLKFCDGSEPLSVDGLDTKGVKEMAR